MIAPSIARGPLEIERSSRKVIATHQADRLTELIRSFLNRNQFYSKKFRRARLSINGLAFPDDLQKLPLTTKAELIDDQSSSPPWGTGLSEPVSSFSRYNQTSSTTGNPLRWIDTPESWRWMLGCWDAVYKAARVSASDRILFPFSFGPFLGFWTAFDAGVRMGAFCIPTGGMTSESRLALIETLEPTVICCTPTYALRLLDVASENRNRHLDSCSVRTVIVAGEPGGSIPSTRRRIESGWGARVIDHHGLTEVGPLSYECWEAPGFLHLNETEFIVEILKPGTDQIVPDGQQGELIVTNLGRTASPVIRYRTGDIVVRTREKCSCGRTTARLVGGVLARTDDMINVKGVNVFPTAIESVVRSFQEVVEFQTTVIARKAMRSLSVTIEVDGSIKEPSTVEHEVERKLHEALGLSISVTSVELGTLPRFDMKARRFIVE